MKLSLWKVLGVAGVAGVAATGAIIARDQRQRAQLSPDEVRERLQLRLAEADGTGPQTGTQTDPQTGETRATTSP